MDWDVFISHAWEDKEDIARPLAEALREAGLRVWYDEFTLTLGDSLRRSIDRGLAQSRYGVVILSPNFFAKEWPQRELDGLVTREVSSGKTILPIWHNVTWEDVRRFSPTLADKLAVSTAKGLDAVVEEILRALREEHRPRPRPVAKPTPAKPRRPVNWKMVGAIAGIGLLIALGTWLVPSAADLLSAWLFETLTAILTSSPTHVPVIPTPAPPTLTPVPVVGATMVWDKDGSVMVYVPGGEFIMGSGDTDVDSALALCNEVGGDCERSWFDNEQPQHTVYLDAFHIDKTEVTNAQFARFLNEMGNREEGGVTWLGIGDEACLITWDGEQYQPKSGYENHPIIEVSWYGARAYCEWVGKRLPTEAEWEKACRGADGWIYPWGSTFNGNKVNFCDKNCSEELKDISVDDGYARTAPVGTYSTGVSLYGALDMAGNVREWVADWYDSGYYSRSPRRNPPGPDSGEKRVIRGGSWQYSWRLTRCPYRSGWSAPTFIGGDVGFRCAR
jgi:formylglycine-generating enzyme required for sulfatase activity